MLVSISSNWPGYNYAYKTSRRRELTTQMLSIKNERLWAILMKAVLNKRRNNFKFCAKYLIPYNHLHINGKKNL